MHIMAKVIMNFNVKPDYYLLGFHAPEISRKAKPGQFVHIRCKNSKDPLIRRPFSFYSIDESCGIIKILYEVKGIGTKLLSSYKEGEYLDVLAPMGNGFQMNNSIQGAVLVGGGVGGAPMVAVAKSLVDMGIKDIQILLGAQTRDKIIPTSGFEALGLEVQLATEDGSCGHHGYVTDLLTPILDKINHKKYTVMACGPQPMLKTTAEICNSKNCPCQLSMDAIITCGVGACQGCVCKVKEDSEEIYHRACIEGPVFNSQEVVWDV